MNAPNQYTNSEFERIILDAKRHDQPPVLEKSVPGHAAGGVVWRYLRDTYPIFAECRPLAAGIVKQIERPPWMLNRSLRSALRLHTSTEKYLRALAAPDSQRYSLDGLVVGGVSEKHRARARQQLKALSGRKRQRVATDSEISPPNVKPRLERVIIACAGESPAGLPKLVAGGSKQPTVIIRKRRKI